MGPHVIKDLTDNTVQAYVLAGLCTAVGFLFREVYLIRTNHLIHLKEDILTLQTTLGDKIDLGFRGITNRVDEIDKYLRERKH